MNDKPKHAKLADREDVNRVLAGHRAGNFSTPEDASTAIRLCDASYYAGRVDVGREICAMLGIRL